MDDDGFDHSEVMTCLKSGKAYGPEPQKGQLRANVRHRGLQIRVAVGGLDGIQEDWTKLLSLTVITVMEEK